MGLVIAVMVVITIMNVWFMPWLLKRMYRIRHPYYAVAVAVTLVLGILNFIFRDRYSFILIMLYIAAPTGSVLLTDAIIGKTRKDPIKKEAEQGFVNIYDSGAVMSKAYALSDELLGFIRFRMDGISYAVAVGGDKQEKPLLTYTRPLHSETELNELVNEFISRYQKLIFDSDGVRESEWKVSTQIRHDDQSAYHLLLIFGCDHDKPVFGQYTDFYKQYTKNDIDPYQEETFRTY